MPPSRRQPPNLPGLGRLTGPAMRRVVQDHLEAAKLAYRSLPTAHAETHAVGGSDQLDEFLGQFLLVAASSLLPNARRLLVDGTTLQQADGGAGANLALSVAPNGIGDTHLRDSAARSVIGRAAATAGDPADIAATADGQVLQRSAGVLTWAGVPYGARTVTTPAAVAADQTAFAFSAAYYHRVTSDVGRSWQGFVAGTDGEEHVLVNVGSNSEKVTHQDAAATAVNRVICQGGADIALPPDFGALLWYDATTARWRAYAL